MKAEEIVRVLDIVNPDKIPGKVTLISRYGADKVGRRRASQAMCLTTDRAVPSWPHRCCQGHRPRGRVAM